MNDEALATYVRELADRMILRDWTIFVSSDPDEEPEDGIDDARNATAQFTYGRRAVSIWFNPTYIKDAKPEELRQTVCHELVHCHVEASREVMANAITPYAQRTSDMLMGIYNVQQEYGVDALADLIAPFMPLPSKKT